MRRFGGRALVAMVAVTVLAFSSLPASAGGQIGAQACSSPRTLAHIINRFSWAERRTWHRGFDIAALDAPRFRYNILHGPSAIRHTHCVATAIMSHGARHTVYYAIEEGMGFASMGTGIDYCVLGLDPWRVHDSACRTVR